MDIVEEGAAHRDVQVLHVVKGERRFAWVFDRLRWEGLVVAVEKAGKNIKYIKIGLGIYLNWQKTSPYCSETSNACMTVTRKQNSLPSTMWGGKVSDVSSYFSLKNREWCKVLVSGNHYLSLHDVIIDLEYGFCHKLIKIRVAVSVKDKIFSPHPFATFSRFFPPFSLSFVPSTKDPSFSDVPLSRSLRLRFRFRKSSLRKCSLANFCTTLLVLSVISSCAASTNFDTRFELSKVPFVIGSIETRKKPLTSPFSLTTATLWTSGTLWSRLLK